MAKAKSVSQSRNLSAPLDFDQLKLLTIDQVRSKIVSLGGDWNQVEKRTDLIGRLVQLQGTAQPIAQIKKQLEQHGITETGLPNEIIPIQTKRLTIEQMKKAMKKFIDKGMIFKVSKDGEQWQMIFPTEQARQDGKIVKATKRDSGNTMIPLLALQRCAEAVTTVTVIKRKKDDDADDGFVDVSKEQDEDEAVA